MSVAPQRETVATPVAARASPRIFTASPTITTVESLEGIKYTLAWPLYGAPVIVLTGRNPLIRETLDISNSPNSQISGILMAV